MKKLLTIGMITMLALTAAACGKKADNTAGSAAETTAAAGPVESLEAVGESLVTVTVQKVDGDRLTVELDDGQSMTFDISGAQKSAAWDLMAGDEVEIGFDGEDPVDGMAVRSVVMSVPFEFTNEDYSEVAGLYGLVESVDDKTITVRELLDERNEAAADKDPSELTDEDFLGESYTFTRPAYETVITKDGVKAGQYVEVNYTGVLIHGPVSFRIVTEDMEEDEASDVISVTGKVQKVEEGVIYLQADEDTLFRFNAAGDEDIIQAANSLVGKSAMITFSDSLNQRVATADAIEAA